MSPHDMNFVAQILDMARTCSISVEVYLRREETTRITWGTEGTRAGSSRHSARGTVRVIVDGCLGWSTGSLALPAQQMFSMACINARFGPPVTWTFANSGENPHEHDANLSQPSDLLNLCEQAMYLATMIRQRWRNIHAVATVTITESRRALATSSDAVWNYECPRAKVTLSARVSRVAQDISYINIERSGVALAPLLAAAIESIEARLAILEHPVQSLERSVPIVLAPETARAFLLHTLTMSCVPTGEPNWFAIPRHRWHRSLTIWDDATATDFPGSAPCDDEGVPSQLTLLVENGLPCGYIVDRALAAQYRVPPTGNGIRDETGLPAPQFRNIVIEPQQGGEPRAIAELPAALLVYDMSLIETADAAQVAARIDLAAFMRWGEPIHRVTNGVLHGDFVEALRTAIPMDGCAAVASSMAIPSLLIEGGLAVQV